MVILSGKTILFRFPFEKRIFVFNNLGVLPSFWGQPGLGGNYEILKIRGLNEAGER